MFEILLTQPLDYWRTAKQLGHAPKIENVMRGMYTRLVGVLPMRAVFWGAQMHVLDACNGMAYAPVFAGLAAASAQTIMEVPFEVFKVRRMESNVKIPLLKTLQECIKGSQWHFARNAGFAVAIATGKHMVDGVSSPSERLGTIAAATIVGTVLTQPFDTMKTRAQSKNGHAIRGAWMHGVGLRSAQCTLAMVLGAFAVDVASSILETS